MAIDFNFFDDLPDNWETARVKNILDYNHHYPIGDGDHGSIKPEMYQDEGIPYLRVQNLSWGFDINYDNLVYISDEVNLANSKSILIPDDILIAKTGATVGKMAIIPKSMPQANTTSSVGKITINSEFFNIKYFAYLFSSPMFQEQIKQKAYQKSAQPGFNIDDLIEFKIIIPPFNEEKQIANYLDNKTAKIDETILQNQQLIELLEEKRVALINQVVTKGLNPDVGMKDSGVEWIGKIPEHWKIVIIKELFENRSEKVSDKIYPPLSVTKKGVVPQLENAAKTDNNDSRKKVLVGDFVINSRSDRRGSCGVSNYDGSVSLIYHVLKPKQKYMANYYHYLFRSKMFAEEFYRWGHGIVDDLWSTRYDEMKKILVPVPPKDEMKEIVKYLNSKLNYNKTMIDKIKYHNDLLNEYKTSLIHHVVTGKIDVIGEEI